MERGGQNLLDMCNPDRNFLPYFNVPDPGAAASDHAWNHNIGRWLDATLRLEETIGWKIPPEREAAMVENLTSTHRRCGSRIDITSVAQSPLGEAP
jgi:hypothetical protein